MVFMRAYVRLDDWHSTRERVSVNPHNFLMTVHSQLNATESGIKFCFDVSSFYGWA